MVAKGGWVRMEPEVDPIAGKGALGLYKINSRI
jgi:hypothetical protein